VKRALLILAWLGFGVGLYAGLVGLELYWNLFDWRPRLDANAAALMLVILALVAASWFLARGTADSLTRTVAIVVCLALFALGLYVLPPEAIKAGLFARTTPSPWWYRVVRWAGLSLPGGLLGIWQIRTKRL
jgi:signal transduction histidine kinase